MRNTVHIQRRTAILSGLFAAVLSAPAWGAIPAHPGMLNYVEGQASIDGRTVGAKSVGSVDVEQGQTLETGKGKAEILLTPGVFLRLGDNSALRMDNAGLTHTSVALLHGEAMVEADDINKENNIQVVEKNTATTLDKNGIYKFNADQGQVSVYDGRATVTEGDQHVDLKKGKDTSLDRLHAVSFDKNQVDDLYQWSDLRSRYLSEASVGSARTYANNAGWAGGGWYWNPYYSFYSWLPGDGLFYSPFGYGFFSPGYAYGGYPIVLNRGFGNRGYAGSGNRGFVGGTRVARPSGFASGGFHASSFGGGGGRGGRR
jgi:hypothetical protein